MKHLNRKEIAAAETLFSSLCASGDALDRKLEEIFEDSADEVKEDIINGVDRFYALYEKDVDEEVIRDLLDRNMEGMPKVKQYSYLANLSLALTHVCGNILEGERWSQAIDEHQVIMKALDMGLMTEDSQEVQAGIDEMLELIAVNVDACSVLFIGEPPYEKLFSACMTEKPEDVKALAINTRSSAVNMAAALYILQERGELPSLGDTRIPARDMGVMAASLMEIDAAHKSGSWEGVRKIVEKASKTAAVLLVSSPDLMKDAAFFACVGIFTNFATLWMLVAGVIVFINARIHHETNKEHMEPVFKVGAKLLNVTLDMAQKVSHKLLEWVQITVLPKVLPVWRRCRDFTVNCILIPSAAFLIKAKEEVLRVAGITVDKAESAYTHLREEASDIIDRAKNRYHSSTEEEAEEIELFDTEEDEEEHDIFEDEAGLDEDSITLDAEAHYYEEGIVLE